MTRKTFAGRNLLVLGATGGTGRQVVEQAVERGHQVTAFMRNPEKLGPIAGRIRVVRGSLPQDRDALIGALRGQDAVISALGAGNSLRPHGLIERSMPAIVQAMEASGVQRLIFTSSFGVGGTARAVPTGPRILIALFLRGIYADKQAGEEILRRSSLDWTLVYPVTLTGGARTGRYRAGEDLALSGFPRISRADLADFLLSQVDDERYLRKGVLVSSSEAPSPIALRLP